MSKHGRSPKNVPSVDLFDLSELIRAALVLALVVVRWLVPTESAPEGDTLWIVQLWFRLPIWVWSRFRTKKWSVRLNAFDAAMWVVILGHVVSTATVFWNGGIAGPRSTCRGNGSVSASRISCFGNSSRDREAALPRTWPRS